MIRLFLSILTLFIIFSASFINARWVDNMTQDYILKLTMAQEYIEKEENWNEALKLTETVYHDWNNRSFPLYVLLRHNDLDQILASFQSVSQYIQEADKEPYTANNAQLITYLTLLSEMEQCTLQNIF